MSQLYEASGLSVAPTATQDNAYCQLWNANTTKDIALREFGYTNTVATASKMGIKRTTARGTNTTTVTGVARQSTGASTGTLDLTWSVEATKTGNYLRRAHVAGVIGAGLLWTWWGSDDGLVIPQATGLAIVVPTAVAGSAGEVWMVWEE